MRRGVLILVLGVALAALAYAGFYFAGTARSREMLQSPQPELAWLKQEYHLSDAEFARLTELHNAYLPKCAVHCRRIADLTQKLEHELRAASGVTPEIKKLLSQRAQERADCQAEMLEHFFAVSRTMPPDQGRRYLAWVQQQTCLQEAPMMNHTEMMEGNPP
jgi:Heavy-metal resistance